MCLTVSSCVTASTDRLVDKCKAKAESALHSFTTYYHSNGGVANGNDDKYTDISQEQAMGALQ